MTVKDGLNAAEVAAQKAADDAAREARRIAHERAIERQGWKQLYQIYERCVGIAGKVWDAKLEAAQHIQESLAKEMRDRYESPGKLDSGLGNRSEIPVPLFTPRDRQQFLKEVAATLLISADRRQLTVFYPKEDEGACADVNHSQS